jgi:glycosyltransferase involved in cell wall biosynthesis
MRIGFFTDNYLPSRDGIAISIETSREQLEAMGHEVFIIAPAPGLRYKEKSKRVIRFPAVKGLFYDDYMTSIFFPPQALRRIDKLKLDIVHYHTPGQVGFLGAQYAIKNKLPLVTTYHTDLAEYVSHYKNTLPGLLVLSMMTPFVTGGGLAEYRTALSSIKPERNLDVWNQKIVEQGVTMIHNACDVVIAPSVKIKHKLEKWHPTSPIEIIPSGVDKIQTTARDIAAWRSKLNLPEGTPVITFVGRLGTEKNLDLLVKAFEIITKKMPKVRLLVVGGTGSHTESAEGTVMAEARSRYHNDKIIFTGYVPHEELGGLYGLANVFAFPSLTDTQGLVLNEAALAGLPIVMIDRDMTQIVEEGQNGHFAKANPKDFANKLMDILRSPDKQVEMGLRSIQLASDYSASHQALKLLRLYQEVIERHYAKTPSTKRRSLWGRKSAS